jgi:hypothetical protein
MKLWISLTAIAIATFGTLQDRSVIGDFSKSPDEHIIQQIDKPFLVRSVQGIIDRQSNGPAEPLANVLFEIQGPGSDHKIRRATTGKDGKFRMRDAPPGSYKFKATLSGFQSVMGTVIIDKRASKTERIEIAMPIGV